MRKGIVKYNNIDCGQLSELESGEYEFVYFESYVTLYPEQFVSFQMPVTRHAYRSKQLFPFFDGLIPEGWLLSIAIESWKIDKNDRMGLLLACCQSSIGAVSVHPLTKTKDDEVPVLL